MKLVTRVGYGAVAVFIVSLLLGIFVMVHHFQTERLAYIDREMGGSVHYHVSQKSSGLTFWNVRDAETGKVLTASESYALFPSAKRLIYINARDMRKAKCVNFYIAKSPFSDSYYIFAPTIEKMPSRFVAWLDIIAVSLLFYAYLGLMIPYFGLIAVKWLYRKWRPRDDEDKDSETVSADIQAFNDSLEVGSAVEFAGWILFAIFFVLFFLIF